MLLGTARAVADAGEADAHYRRGAELYAEGKYRDAAAAFQSAYAADPLAKYVYNQAQAERMAGDCESAVVTYQRFLGLEPIDEQRRQAEDNIAACKAMLVEEPQPVAPLVEPPPPRAANPPPPVQPRTVPRPVPAEEEPSPFSDPWGGALLGVGIAALGVGGGLLGWSFSLEDDAADAATQSGRTYEQHADALDLASTARTTGIILMAAGGAFLGGAALRYALVGQTQVAIGPATIAVAGRFSLP
jgi:tetratricopeptide (TPR) repeat protein